MARNESALKTDEFIENSKEQIQRDIEKYGTVPVVVQWATGEFEIKCGSPYNPRFK